MITATPEATSETTDSSYASRMPGRCQSKHLARFFAGASRSRARKSTMPREGRV